MATHSSRSQGFVLIAALILLFLLSGIAVGLLMLTTSETRISGNDKESNRAYYAAESGMEKLTSDLAALYQTKQSPTTADFNALAAVPPTTAMVGPATYTESITRPLDAGGNPISTWRVISSGSNQGLTALIVPLTLQVNAVRPSTADANMTRNVEVALIPVFQFGVFSDSDLSYFNGPPFQFAGRVHTNSNFFPTPGGILTFGDKVTVAGEIIRDRLANGFDSSGSYSNNVYIPNASGGCNAYIGGGALGSNCIFFDKPQASWIGGIPAAGGNNAPNWTPYYSYVGNGRLSGVKKLVLPFVAGGGDQIEIVRKPLQSESATSALGSSRLYNKANIRILLADQIQFLHPERSLATLDAQDVNLGTLATAGTQIAVTGAPGPTALAFANPTWDANWQAPTSVGVATTNFPLITGYLRVEFKNAAGNWIGVTNEWLGLGFARDTGAAPTVPGTDLVHPNALMRLQEVADRTCAAPSTCLPQKLIGINDLGNDRSAAGIAQGKDFYPINFYDPREGERRDTVVGAAACKVNGIMNAIEIDAGNLQMWLAGTIGATGNQVENTAQNGYLLYFSDRRGMLQDPNSLPTPNILTGEYGFEDVVNIPTDAVGTPNGGLPEQGEDLDQNGLLDAWGAANVGDGFRQATVGNPYAQIDCMAQGRMNKVTGARHVLRLTDSGLGKLPFKVNADGTIGGFTVASENPVYVWGDYNANTADGAFVDAGHVPAAVIADSVTLLSRNWDDERGMNNATSVGGRPPTETYYRLAIAAGKSLTFSNPTGAISKDWGTDGGLHNFLRYIENWGGIPLHYNGSLVSLYYSQYATGTFKCCKTVYGAPNRKYAFDTLFLNPSNLPPGTPMFQDIVNLTYRQDFTPY